MPVCHRYGGMPDHLPLTCTAVVGSDATSPLRSQGDHKMDPFPIFQYAIIRRNPAVRPTLAISSLHTFPLFRRPPIFHPVLHLGIGCLVTPSATCRERMMRVGSWLVNSGMETTSCRRKRTKRKFQTRRSMDSTRLCKYGTPRDPGWKEDRFPHTHEDPSEKPYREHTGIRGVGGQVAKRSSRGQSMCKTFCPKSRQDQIFSKEGREAQEGKGRDYLKGSSEHLRRNPSFGGQNSRVAPAKRVDRHIHAALRLPAISRLPDPITEGFVRPHEDKNCLLCQESSQVRL